MSAKRRRQQRFAFLFPIVCFLFSVGIPWLPLSVKVSGIENGILFGEIGLCVIGWIYYIRISWEVVKNQKRRNLLAVILYQLLIGALLGSAYENVQENAKMIRVIREAG